MSTNDLNSYLRKVIELIDACFSIEEIGTISLLIGVEPENLPGSTKNAKARELVLYAKRRGKILQLIEILKEERPRADWPQASAPQADVENEETDFAPLNQFGLTDREVVRRPLLEDLDEWLTSEVPIAGVFGPTGIGKSILAQQFCRSAFGKDRQVVYIDLEQGVLKPVGNPKAYAQSFVRKLIHQLHLESDLELGSTATSLAQEVRQRQLLLVVDQLELVLHSDASSATGTPADEFAEFFEAFLCERFGPGRLLLISNIRPLNIARHVDKGWIRVVSNETSRDRLQIGGFTLNEFIEFIQAGGYSDEHAEDAFELLAGHPKALGIFLSLQTDLQEKFLANRSGDAILETDLHQLLHLSISTCSEHELELLGLLSEMRRPEQASFIVDAFGLEYEIEPIRSALSSLRRRSLVEFGTIPRPGYTAHNIVKQYMRNARPMSRSQELHSQIATGYVSRYSQSEEPSTLEQIECSIEASYHLYLADRVEEAVIWRNRVTTGALSMGGEAFHSGNFESARESAELLIAAANDLIQTPATNYYLSKAHFHAAWNQHHIEFDWGMEVKHLEKSLLANSKNSQTIDFLGDFFRDATKARLAWDIIEGRLGSVVDHVRSVFNDSTEMDPLKEISRRTLIELLCIWARYTLSSSTRANVIHELEVFARDGKAYLNQLAEGNRENVEKKSLIAYYNLYELLSEFEADLSRSNALISLANEYAVIGHEKFESSKALMLQMIRSYQGLAKHASTEADRAAYLMAAQEKLEQMRQNNALPSGYVRALSVNALELSRRIPSSEGIELVNRVRFLVSDLESSERAYSIASGEISSAKLRLDLQASRLDPTSARTYLAPALSRVRRTLSDQESWLSLEEAGLISKMYGDHWIDLSTSRDNGDYDVANESTQHSFQLSSRDIRLFDKKLIGQNAVYATPQWDLLRLTLRLQYLRSVWKPNMRPGPRKMARQAMQLAVQAVARGPHSYEMISTVLELLVLVMRRTYSKLMYDWYFKAALEIVSLALDGPYSRTGGLMLSARLLRAAHDYRGARTALNEYLDTVTYPYLQAQAYLRFVDCVGHSIFPDAVLNPEIDPSLKADARRASEGYQRRLEYFEVSREDIEDFNSAVRELLWVRCVFLAEEIGVEELAWLDRVYAKLRFTKHEDGKIAISNAHILGELVEYPNRTAQIAGTHWNSGAIWRELASLASAMLTGTPDRLQKISYLLDIATMIEAAGWEVSPGKMAGRYRGRGSYNLGKLNLARILLEYPSDTQYWTDGSSLLSELLASQPMPWVYWRYALELGFQAKIYEPARPDDEYVEQEETKYIVKLLIEIENLRKRWLERRSGEIQESDDAASDQIRTRRASEKRLQTLRQALIALEDGAIEDASAVAVIKEELFMSPST